MTQNNPREGRSWPGYILGGRLRTSTLVLIIAFLAIGWLYETYEPGPDAPAQIPASEVVPPGFIPDPAYTWAPRTDVQRRTPTPTPTETTEVTPTTTPPSGTETAPTTHTTPTSGSPTPTTSGPPSSASPQPVATTTPASPSASPSASLPPLTHPTAVPTATPTP